MSFVLVSLPVAEIEFVLIAVAAEAFVERIDECAVVELVWFIVLNKVELADTVLIVFVPLTVVYVAVLKEECPVTLTSIVFYVS